MQKRVNNIQLIHTKQYLEKNEEEGQWQSLFSPGHWNQIVYTYLHTFV